jgi:exodeoxyribonuclease VII small subunit
MNDTIKEREAIPKDIQKMSFEKAYAALKAATDRLEAEEVDLETTLKEYARASALARHCANLLDDAEKRVQVLIESEGVIQLTPLDTEPSD